MMAGTGFDTVPPVRQWAETHRMLYLPSFATEKGLSSLKFSFEPAPSVEQFGAVAGRYVGAHFPKDVGVVWRNSPNWQGGRDRFVAEVKARGGNVPSNANIPVTQNQGNYSSVIKALKDANIKTVLGWINVLEFAQLEEQAAQQNYFPRWVVAGFNLVTDTVGGDINGSKGPPAIGIWVTPEYHSGEITGYWKDEVAVMRAAYAEFDSGHTVTDTDWQGWLAFKQLTQMFKDCGQDCTRNKLAGMYLSGYKTKMSPLCQVDFARGKGKVGSFAFNIWKAVQRGSANGWQQIETCKESF
jgi:ABC-type branched-subunit amino acid transport system substrate-binding protein